jgi:hypothetical protein
MAFKKTYRLVLEFSAEAPDEVQIDDRWQRNNPAEKVLHDQTVRALYAALLGVHQQSLRNFILVDIVGIAVSGVTRVDVAQYFPEIAEHSPDHVALAPAIASLSTEQRQFLADMEEKGVFGEAIEDIYDAVRVELQNVTLEETA